METRRTTLAGLAGIKASGEENTVRGAVQTTLGRVLQVSTAQGPGAAPTGAAVGRESGRCHCYNHKGLQEALLVPCRSRTLPLPLAVRVGGGATVTQLDQSSG